ncbi:MAG TPA: Gmad2 immunoglobulin-like domain-containing protein [Candidatus Paceibacterota bacterium]|nr:Gmad2 immunoglobulin-like domain-containing protein [Candidatus Paceibacterota bacterium]
MNKWLVTGIIVLLVAICAGVALIVIPAPAQAPATSDQGQATTTPAITVGIADLITVDTPASGAAVSSPIAISGSARGNWYFEASFPIELKNSDGTVIAQMPGQAQGDWMTSDFVPFTASLTFPAQPAGSHGTLVLMNDNPSGDPAKQKEVDIPVIFQ